MKQNISSQSNMSFSVFLRLSETEARALKAITDYGAKQFLEVFKSKLGKSGIEDSENGIVSLFRTVREELPPHLTKMDKTRKLWS